MASGHDMDYDTRGRDRTQSQRSNASYDDTDSMSAPIVKNDDDEDVSAWVKCKHCLRSLWATRQTEIDNLGNHDVYVKTTVRELIVYILFLVVLSIVAFGMVNINMFYLTDSMTNLYVRRFLPDGYTNYDNLVTIDDYWNWLSTVMVSSLYWTQWYNGNYTNSVYYENTMLGQPRIRQLRNIKNNHCSVPSLFASYIPYCYSTWDGTKASDPNFQGPTTATLSNYSYSASSISAWNYNPQDSGSSYIGLVSTYDNDGYSQLLPNQTAAAQIINMLQQLLWIDQGTRAVFIEFTIYNADVNLFCIAQIAVELPPTGGVIPSYMFRTVKLLRYVTTFDYVILGCEFVYLAFILYFIVEEVLEIKKLKCDYFKSFWSWLDIIIIVVSIILAGFDIFRSLSVNSTLGKLVNNPNQYSDFTFLGYWQTQFQNAIAVTVFFAYLKVFKYVSFNKTMTQLQVTLSRCAGELFGFAIIFFITFLSYAMLGYLIFGANLVSYKSLSDSIFAQFRIILGDFDFDGMYRVNSFLGPLFFISYIFFVFFILLQMFLAIINDSYATVKTELENQKNDFELVQYLKSRLGKMMDKLSFKKKEIFDIQDAIQQADVNKDGNLDLHDLRDQLKKRGYADAEIEAAFARHDIDTDRMLNETEVLKMQASLERDKAQLNTEMNTINTQMNAVNNSLKGTSIEEYHVLTKRVERTESSISSIVTKIDTVLEKMELLEKTKAQRREALNSVIETMKALGDEPDPSEEAERREQLENFTDGEVDKWQDGRPTSGRRPGSSSSSGKSVLFYNDKKMVRPNSGSSKK